MRREEQSFSCRGAACCAPAKKLNVGADLLDDNAHEFLFSGAKKKISWVAEIDIFPGIIGACPIDFHSALLD